MGEVSEPNNFQIQREIENALRHLETAELEMAKAKTTLTLLEKWLTQ